MANVGRKEFKLKKSRTIRDAKTAKKRVTRSKASTRKPKGRKEA